MFLHRLKPPPHRAASGRTCACTDLRRCGHVSAPTPATASQVLAPAQVGAAMCMHRFRSGRPCACTDLGWGDNVFVQAPPPIGSPVDRRPNRITPLEHLKPQVAQIQPYTLDTTTMYYDIRTSFVACDTFLTASTAVASGRHVVSAPNPVGANMCMHRCSSGQPCFCTDSNQHHHRTGPRRGERVHAPIYVGAAIFLHRPRPTSSSQMSVVVGSFVFVGSVSLLSSVKYFVCCCVRC